MQTENPSSPSAEHDPTGADGPGVGASDPLFQATEPPDRTPRRAALLWQYFFFPLLIVGAAVGVFLFFGLLGGTRAGPDELLERVRSGGENQQQQAAHQLALLITKERARVEAGERPDEPPFYAEPKFREGLREALRIALDEGGEDRQAWILVALGLMQDTDALPLYEQVLYPEAGQTRPGSVIRLRAMQGLFQMESPRALALLARTAGDDNAEVRALTHLVLARLVDEKRPHGGRLAVDPRVLDLLRDGLSDSDGGVRVNAAVGLALAGEPAGAALVERSLDRDALAAMGIEDAAVQRGALLNAIRAAARLHETGHATDALRAAVVRLADSKHEGEDIVRQRARDALEDWSTS